MIPFLLLEITESLIGEMSPNCLKIQISTEKIEKFRNVYFSPSSICCQLQLGASPHLVRICMHVTWTSKSQLWDLRIAQMCKSHSARTNHHNMLVNQQGRVFSPLLINKETPRSCIELSIFAFLAHSKSSQDAIFKKSDIKMQKGMFSHTFLLLV